MGKRLEVKQLDQERLIRQNDLRQVTNPSLFNANNGPTPDGLLSQEIFGITKEERAGICAYIDLSEYFIQPYFYKIWLNIDRNLRSCVYETQNFRIDKNGYLVPDENGETGVKFLRKNISKINFKESKKSEFLKVLHDAKKNNLLFTSKLIVIPPFYRDVNTTNGKIGVGDINRLYIAVLNNVKALKGSNSYGLDLAGNIRGRIQDNLLEIYNWFTIGKTSPSGEATGSGIFKKFGAMRRTVMSKTVDNSVRLVISAPKYNGNKREDLMVDLDYSAIPLSAALATMYPFVIYYLRQYFQNEFGGKRFYNVINPNTGQPQQLEFTDNPNILFSDDRFDAEINEFIHGYSNRLKAVELPLKSSFKFYHRFKGYRITEEEYARGIRENGNIIERDTTWVDIFYQICCKAAEDKMAIISRYPIEICRIIEDDKLSVE